MERIKEIIDKVGVDCRIRKHGVIRCTVLDFDKLPRRKIVEEIKTELKHKGYNAVCGFTTINVFSPKRKIVECVQR